MGLPSPKCRENEAVPWNGPGGTSTVTAYSLWRMSENTTMEMPQISATAIPAATA